jgi:hypothetical protein
LLEWTLIVIAAANSVALLLMEGMAEALGRTWPKVEAPITFMTNRFRNT